MICIYKLTNTITGDFYIGQTIYFNKRIKNHLNIKKQANNKIKQDLIKYGEKAFKAEVIEECEKDKLNEREFYWIEKLKPSYNCKAGGGCKSNSTETINKLSEKCKRSWEHLDEKTKQKIIKNNLKGPQIGHKVSEETRIKIRNSLNNYFANRPDGKQSKETIEKRKETIRIKKENGYIQTNASHKKKILCIETGVIYDSVKEAGKKNNVHPSCITCVVKGKYKTCKGKHYEYYKDDCSVTTNDDECNRVE